jgi:hypothetical protein
MPKLSPCAAFTKKAVELGAEEAKITDAGSITTAAWVRLECRF